MKCYCIVTLKKDRLVDIPELGGIVSDSRLNPYLKIRNI
jgi:hypothetical protein